jgi:hypothetical protein
MPDSPVDVSSSEEEVSEPSQGTSTGTAGTSTGTAGRRSAKRKLFKTPASQPPTKKRASSKRSALWQYFETTNDKNVILCKLCDGKPYRTNNSSTGPMHQHMKADHPKEYKAYHDSEARNEQELVQQQKNQQKFILNPTITSVVVFIRIYSYLFVFIFIYS